MAKFNKMVITRAGLDMIAESQAGGTLIFTKAKLGDGQIDEQSIPDLTDLVNAKMNTEISTVTAKSEGHVEIKFVVDNQELDVGFFVREVGIFAKVNDEGVEKLYGYANAGNYTNYLSDKDTPIDSIITKLDVVVGNASNVSFTNDKSIVYVTLEDMEDAIAAHDENDDAHADFTGATASAAGKRGMVPAPQAGDQNKALFGDKTYKSVVQSINGIVPDAQGKINLVTGINMLARNKAYAYGDIAYSPNLPTWAYLYCVQAGTTAAAEPSFASVTTMGQYITDGTVRWIVDDVRFGLPVGVVFYDKKLRPGCVKFNGATVQRSDYVRIFHDAEVDNAFYDKDDTYTFTGTTTVSGTTITGISAEDIEKLQTAKEVCGDGILITGTGIPEDCMIDTISTDSVTITVAATAAGTVQISYGNIHNYPYLYGWGDGVNTFTLPNYRARVLQGGDNAAWLSAGLPDITGEFRDSGYHRGGGYFAGAFYNTLSDGDTSNEGASRAGGRYGFAASRSNSIYGSASTVQPPALRLILQAKF